MLVNLDIIGLFLDFTGLISGFYSFSGFYWVGRNIIHSVSRLYCSKLGTCLQKKRNASHLDRLTLPQVKTHQNESGAEHFILGAISGHKKLEKRSQNEMRYSNELSY